VYRGIFSTEFLRALQRGWFECDSISCVHCYILTNNEGAKKKWIFPGKQVHSIEALISRVILMQASAFNKTPDVQGNSNGDKCNLHYRSLPRERSTMEARDLALKSLCTLKIP